MPTRGVIPETQLVFSAELAGVVGLEEAILLQQLNGLYLHQPATRRDGLDWLHVSRHYLLQLLPFWDAAALQRICLSLESLGLLHLDHRNSAPDSLLFALGDSPGRSAGKGEAPPATAERPVRRQAPDTATRRAETGPKTPRPRSAEGQPLPPDFQPSEDMLELLERFHGVPRNFALQQLEDFTLYWRERGSANHAWQNKFKQHVQFQWARQQQERGSEHGGQRDAGTAGRTRDSSLEQDLTDTSWAD